MLLPENAPDEYHNRQALWNAVEAKENRSNSRYARQFVIATPKEWNEQETIERSRVFIQQALVSKGMCVDWAFHRKENNPHIHIMATVRGFNQDGSWAQMEKKVYALDAEGNKIPDLDENGVQKTRARTRNGVTSYTKLWKRITVQANDWNKREFLNEVKRQWAETCNENVDRGIPTADAGGVGGIGEDRAGIIQHLADTAAELRHQTQKLHRRHRHR